MSFDLLKEFESFNEKLDKIKKDSDNLVESDKRVLVEQVKLYFKEDMDNLKPKKLPFYEKYLFRIKKWLALRKI